MMYAVEPSLLTTTESGQGHSALLNSGVVAVAAEGAVPLTASVLNTTLGRPEALVVFDSRYSVDLYTVEPVNCRPLVS